jgi:hypothetical protein
MDCLRITFSIKHDEEKVYNQFRVEVFTLLGRYSSLIGEREPQLHTAEAYMSSTPT